MSWEPMHEEPMRLPKWPFYLGNALLVMAASALAFTSQAPLSPWVMIGIILFVGLGFILSPLPHVIEFATRMRANELAHAQLERSNAQRGEASLLSLQEASERLTHQTNRVEQLHGALEKAVKDLESRLSALEDSVKVLDATGEDMRAWLADRDMPAPASDTGLQQGREAIESAREELQAAAATLKRLEGVEALVERLEGLPAPESPSTFREGSPEALETNGATGSPAATEPEAAVAVDVDAAVEAEVAPEPEAVVSAPQEPEVASTPVEASAEAPVLVEPEPASQPAPEPKATAVPEPEAAPVEVQAEAVPAEAESEGPEQSELLASPEPAPKKRARAKRKRAKKKVAKVDDTAPGLVANVLIGIGNVPYIRGEGPGLSSDKGIPMEFVEIGKWRWTPPEGTVEEDGPLTCRIFKNDAIPADGDPIELTPGERLEVNLRFPR